MNTIYRGDLSTPEGRRNAWIDALFIDHAILRLGWTNFAVVKTGALYRSNHPVPFRLDRFTRTLGLQSIINLRGQCNNGSDALSREAAARLGLDFYDMAMESRGAPHRDRILRLGEIFATMRRPGLLHCKSGADRAGIASAVLVLIDGGTIEQARFQLSLRFGHIRQANTGILDAFLDMYEAERGSKPFLNWVREDYREQALRDSFAAGRRHWTSSKALARFINDRLLSRE